MRAWCVMLLAVGCASAPPAEPEAAPPTAAASEPEPEPPFVCPEERGLCFHIVPASAELIVNDDNRGRLDEIGRDGALFLALPAGIYQVTLRAEGYDTWRGEVSVQEGVETIEVSLTRQE